MNEIVDTMIIMIWNKLTARMNLKKERERKGINDAANNMLVLVLYSEENITRTNLRKTYVYMIVCDRCF